MLATTISVIELLKKASNDMQKKDAKALLYIHADCAVMPSIQTVLLSFMRNQSKEMDLGISYRFAITF